MPRCPPVFSSAAPKSAPPSMRSSAACSLLPLVVSVQRHRPVGSRNPLVAHLIKPSNGSALSGRGLARFEPPPPATPGRSSGLLARLKVQTGYIGNTPNREHG